MTRRRPSHRIPGESAALRGPKFTAEDAQELDEVGAEVEVGRRRLERLRERRGPVAPDDDLRLAASALEIAISFLYGAAEWLEERDGAPL